MCLQKSWKTLRSTAMQQHHSRRPICKAQRMHVMQLPAAGLSSNVSGCRGAVRWDCQYSAPVEMAPSDRCSMPCIENASPSALLASQCLLK